MFFFFFFFFFFFQGIFGLLKPKSAFTSERSDQNHLHPPTEWVDTVEYIDVYQRPLKALRKLAYSNILKILPPKK